MIYTTLLDAETARRAKLIGGDGVGPLPWRAPEFQKLRDLQIISTILERDVVRFDGVNVTFPKKSKPCRRCNGSRFLPQYAHNGGRCYACL